MRTGHPRIRALVLAAVAVLALVLAGHRWIPGAAGTVTDSVLPWLAVPLPPLLLAAALRRRALVLGAALVPALIWAAMFVPVLRDRSSAGGHNLRVATLNLGAAAPAPAVRPLLDDGADVIVLQEVTDTNRDAVTSVITPRLPYHVHRGTVAVFSRFELEDTESVDIRIGWTRALRTTLTTPQGPIRLYAAHVASVRPTMTEERDRTFAALADAVHADPNPRLLLAGDLNTTTTDRRFRTLEPLVDTHQQAGAGFGFTWPARAPVLRPDHILQRGLTTRSSSVVVAPGSDHRAVVADLDE